MLLGDYFSKIREHMNSRRYRQPIESKTGFRLLGSSLRTSFSQFVDFYS